MDWGPKPKGTNPESTKENSLSIRVTAGARPSCSRARAPPEAPPARGSHMIGALFRGYGDKTSWQLLLFRLGIPPDGMFRDNGEENGNYFIGFRV